MTPIRPGGSSTESRLITDMNVTPMVDVMLVLLVIFMITAPMMFRYQPLDLPQEALEETHPDPSPVTLSIRADGTIYLDGVKIVEDTFVSQLSAIGSKSDFAGVRILADTALPYGRLLHVMRLLKEAGITKMTFVSSPGASQG